MMDALSAELLEYVHHGREERNLEYKERWGLQGREERAKLAKEIMAFSNIRDGGVMVIGVKQDGTPVGISEEAAAKFTQDAVAAAVADYVAPYVDLVVTAGHDVSSTPRYFAVIQVKEFAEMPVLCKRDFASVVRQGAIYTRSRRIPEATEVRNEAEMRELLEMAVDKGIRSFYRRLQVASIQLTPAPSDSSLFEAQLRGL